jgi:hypothetical protein
MATQRGSFSDAARARAKFTARPSSGWLSTKGWGSWAAQRLPGSTVQRPTAAKPGTPGAAAAPAAAGAPAAPAYSMSNLPPDAAYDAAMAALAQRRDFDLAALTQARSAGLLEYGFTEGAGGALAFDPNNPFSKAALLKQTFDRSRRGSAQQMGSTGQLYAGAFQNAQDFVNRGELQQSDAMQKALQQFLARNTQSGAEARLNYETGAGQAYGQRVENFRSNPLYEPAASGAGGAPAAAPTAATPARQEFTAKSAAHGGKLWRYYRGASGRPIPIGPA